MHDTNWVHKDIKPENFLVDIDEQRHIKSLKLADFDSAEIPTDTGYVFPHGTHGFASPEMLQDRVFGREAAKKCDIFSLGKSFQDIINMAACERESSCENCSGPHNITNYAEDAIQTKNPLRQLISEMTDPDPAKRPDIDLVIIRLNAMYANANI